MPPSNWINIIKSEWLTLIAGCLGVLIAVLSGLFPFNIFPEQSAVTTRIIVPEAGFDERLDAVSNEVKALKSQVEALSQIPDQTKIAIQLQGISTTVNELKTRHSKLEDVILNNPAKAIEVPLLRKDLDSLKDAHQQSILALKQGVDQVYDLNKWLLGAMAISIVTLAISNLLKGRESDRGEG